MDACEDYMLDAHEARRIITEVVNVTREWRRLAVRLGASKREMDMFGGIFEREWTY